MTKRLLFCSCSFRSLFVGVQETIEGYLARSTGRGYLRGNRDVASKNVIEYDALFLSRLSVDCDGSICRLGQKEAMTRVRSKRSVHLAKQTTQFPTGYDRTSALGERLMDCRFMS